jgi:D-beta-D-heptose 7-phosphate kinase / D-beta-D-heptose 1-phosphate adenosyltransferase
MQHLIEKLGNIRPFKALIVGDYMLDQYVRGAAERLSPDAPVPVLHVKEQESRAGGAGNLCLDIQALEGRALVLGVVGGDVEGTTLRAALEADGCDTRGLVVDDARPTTVKRSLIGLAQHRHPQKMFRLDVESHEPLSEAIAGRLKEAFDELLEEADLVCIEDYGKGVCTEALCQHVIKRARAAGKEVLVDPAAGVDYQIYRGATALTPNRTEAELATGRQIDEDVTVDHNETLAAELRARLDLEALVLTLDRDGALLLERDGQPLHVPTMARQVYDVTGAGDMVLAGLATARAQGCNWEEAVVLANAAAGLEVEVFGVEPIPLARVRQELLRLSRPLTGKVRTGEELQIELDVLRQAGQRIVLTNGCFDVIHAGHVAYLREARRQGDLLVVGVNSDSQVKAQKGEGRPIYPLADRLDILGELQCVDYLIEFAEPTAHELIKTVQPDIYVKGGDYEKTQINEWDLLEGLEAEGTVQVRLLSHRPGLSSTTVIAKKSRLEGA